jgi:phosphatidylserine/phosphatidylglycerophosphate/cardiolipin synthase-like enzyme
MVLAWLGWMSWGSAQADDLRLVLHDPGDQPAPADRCEAEHCTSLLALIEGAEETLDLAFYGFREQTALLEALEAARDRGVRVRGVVDMDVAGANHYTSTAKWMAELPGFRTDHAVDVASAASRAGRYAHLRDRCPRPPGLAGPLQCLAYDLGGGRCLLTAHASRERIDFRGDIMHDKMLIADGRKVWTGSTNASDSGTGGYNANLVMVIDSPTVAAWYTAEFEQMYASGRFHGGKVAQGPMRAELSDGVAVEVLFSPQHQPMTRAVVPRIAAARRSVDVAVFFLTHKGVTQALIDAHQRGVRVRVVLDATGAANEYSKHDVLRIAGIPVKVEDAGGKMHAKSAVIDGEILIGGSMNWTGAGDRDNDENTVVVGSRAHAAQYQAWFDRIWAEIPDRWLASRPDAESRDSRTACTDGADNDYDGRIDAEDPGCGASPPPVAPPARHQVVASQGAPCSWDLVRARD